MSEPSGNDNVVALPQGRSIRRKPVGFINCSHGQVVLDTHLRLCTCKGCGKVIEPFDWLSAWAEDEEKALTAVRGLRAEAEQLREQVTALKKERAAEKSKLDRTLLAQNKARRDA